MAREGETEAVSDYHLFWEGEVMALKQRTADFIHFFETISASVQHRKEDSSIEGE